MNQTPRSLAPPCTGRVCGAAEGTEIERQLRLLRMRRFVAAVRAVRLEPVGEVATASVPA